MSQATVDQIMEMINGLSMADRNILDQRLSEQTELEWRDEVDTARRRAQEKGIDQPAIDKAIHNRR